MLQVIGMGCFSERQRTIEAAAPLAQTMKTLPLGKPSASVTASCSGSAPQAYQTNAVSPAEIAAALSSRKRELHVHELGIGVARGAEAAAGGETQHGAVAFAHQAVHQRQARAACVLDEALHELASQPAALPFVGHDQRDLAA